MALKLFDSGRIDLRVLLLSFSTAIRRSALTLQGARRTPCIGLARSAIHGSDDCTSIHFTKMTGVPSWQGTCHVTAVPSHAVLYFPPSFSGAWVHQQGLAVTAGLMKLKSATKCLLGDTCASINTLLDTNITDLNRNIDCSQPLVPGKRICVRSNPNVPAPPVAACMMHQILDPEVHTCQRLSTLGYGYNRMSYSSLFRINPALYCDLLLPGAAGWDDSVLDSVCVMADMLPGSGGIQCDTRRFYYVRRGDTCGKLIASRYKRKVDLFRSLNGGYDCTVSSLWEGMKLCLP
ncbi:unnamed protein product [Closterium sp. Yama58-4]|nr:unnamed protein product [Closterium sp. Yama58-4]